MCFWSPPLIERGVGVLDALAPLWLYRDHQRLEDCRVGQSSSQLLLRQSFVQIDDFGRTSTTVPVITDK